jgi:16S rRNA (cytosine1402-N4)-methyltransferase
MNIILNSHKPVLIEAIASFVPPNCKFNIFDGTFGGGGYSDFFLNCKAKVFACDSDQNAIDYYNLNNPKNNNLVLVNSNFSIYINDFDDSFFNIIVADLGYSSNQLEFSDRGFSYLKSGEVFDLRYDAEINLPAYKKIRLLNSSQELGKIIFQYSGETFSNRISQKIFDKVTNSDCEILVSDIVKAIEESIPAKFLHKKNSILSRVWQAFRIWINDEFNHLEVFLNSSLTKLKPSGLIIITCFNSLEDKIVTNYMRKLSKKKVIDEFGNTEQFFELVTKKAISPSKEEVLDNIRSRSATLRILRKL